MTTICPSCGAKVLPGDQVCAQCNAAVADSAKPGAVPNPYSSPADPIGHDDLGDLDAGFFLWMLLSPRGRVPRRVWWLGGMAVNGIMYLYVIMLLTIFEWNLVVDETVLYGSAYTEGLVGLAITGPHLLRIWIQLALSIKRCHDRNHSGWFVLWGVIPCVGGLILLIELGLQPSAPGSNQYGQDPTDDARRGRLDPGPADTWAGGLGKRQLPDKLQLPAEFAEPKKQMIQCPYCEASIVAADHVEYCPHCSRPLL